MKTPKAATDPLAKTPAIVPSHHRGLVRTNFREALASFPLATKVFLLGFLITPALVRLGFPL